MVKYYLVHTVIDPQPSKILKILQDGYLYSSSITNQFGLFHGEKTYHVYFSLMSDEPIKFGTGGVSLSWMHRYYLNENFAMPFHGQIN